MLGFLLLGFIIGCSRRNSSPFLFSSGYGGCFGKLNVRLDVKMLSITGQLSRVRQHASITLSIHSFWGFSRGPHFPTTTFLLRPIKIRLRKFYFPKPKIHYCDGLLQEAAMRCFGSLRQTRHLNKFALIQQSKLKVGLL